MGLFEFLNELGNRKIFYRLNKVREAVMVEVAVPGERWEIEFFEDGTIEIEKFKTTGEIYGEGEIKTLFEKFTD